MNKVTLPKFPVQGGCQCGKVRYRLHHPPIVFYICHCTECQKQSSSAFGQSMRVHAEDVEVTGETARFPRQSSSGNILNCDYCPSCGSRLFHHRDVYGAEINIKAGSLDDTSWLKPAGHIWTGSKQPWVQIRQSELAYAGQPPDYEPLTKHWLEMTGLDADQ